MYRSPIRRSLAVAVLVCLLPRGAQAADGEPSRGAALSLAQFERMIVQDSGRKMPMDSYARLQLLQFSGKTTVDRQPAIAWLSRVLFTPESTMHEKIFLINHPHVVQALMMPAEKRRRYSYHQLEPALPKLQELATAASRMESEQRSVVENELMRVYQNVESYLALRYSFEFTQSDPSFSAQDETVRSRMDLPAGQATPTFFDLFTRIGRLRDILGESAHATPEDLSPAQREAFRLNAVVGNWIQRYGNLPPAMIPVHAHSGETWVSPWQVIAVAPQDTGLMAQVTHLSDLAGAYRAGQQLEFDMAARQFNATVDENAAPDRQMAYAAQELLYNKLDLFYRAEILYGLTFMLGFASLFSRRRIVQRASIVLMLLALAPHTAGLALRMAIMGRPPVTNLYSTFVFVSWVAVMLCAVMVYVQKNALGVVAAGFSGLSLLLLSRRFIASTDPMGVLVAVLDSNFWLATHVVTITMGYAGCCLAGLIGHFYIIQKLINPRDHQRLKSIYNALFGVLGFGLTFAFLGTMLGGVWADQSWGRFWGWDPKENGALLIVLWCAILFHARLARYIDDLGMAVGSILGIIVVLFAWVGVNLLGVGLHSYGFTSGVARGLFGYTFVQLLVVAGGATWARRRSAAMDPPSAA